MVSSVLCLVFLWFSTLDLVPVPGVQGVEGWTQGFDRGLGCFGATYCLVHMDLMVWQDVGRGGQDFSVICLCKCKELGASRKRLEYLAFESLTGAGST